MLSDVFDSSNKDGTFCGLPQEGLVATSLQSEGFKRREATGLVSQDQDAPMHSMSFAVPPPWLILRQRGKPNWVLVRFRTHQGVPAPGALETWKLKLCVTRTVLQALVMLWTPFSCACWLRLLLVLVV